MKLLRITPSCCSADVSTILEIVEASACRMEPTWPDIVSLGEVLGEISRFRWETCCS